MDIQIHQPLSNYTTIRIGGPAHFVADIHTVEKHIAASQPQMTTRSTAGV